MAMETRAAGGAGYVEAASVGPAAAKVPLVCRALQETGRSSMKPWQLCLGAVRTKLPCVFRACLGCLAPEICSCFCSDKAYQMYLLDAF